ncbi:hypothetical protein ACEZCY_35730 [Streptacidiphilus sp. N1-12]|uniref:Uncharacterized protein n=1 Tax=Streptacidiphilus alkalitolerans TaxID=3342712 RepID=A0ABV6WR54_9ACTN
MSTLPHPPARIELMVVDRAVVHQLRVGDVEPGRWPRRPRPER